MKKNFINGLFMLAAGVFAVSCADYNETANFTAEPDPTFTEPYKDYAPVKSYIDRSKNPNMSLGVTLRVSEYNKQALAHAAAMTNFDIRFVADVWQYRQLQGCDELHRHEEPSRPCGGDWR